MPNKCVWIFIYVTVLFIHKKRLPPILLLLWVNFLRDFVSLCKISFGRKDMLWRNFRAMQKEFGRDAFDFHPDTFQLPAEHDVLVKR